METKKEIGTLFLVPSPIGNLKEVSPRILEVLRTSDIIACEDTRNTGKLLSFFDISKPLFSCHEHNEKVTSLKLINEIKNGKNVAYLSDAGYPGISDPGEILAQEAIKNNIKVTPLSGPSAFLNALVASNLDTSHFYFYGFLSSKHSDRVKEIGEISSIKSTIILYEAPHRINDTLKDLFEVLGNRKITVARELTKLYEEFIYSDLETLVNENRDFKGELVLILDGNKETEEISDKKIIDLYNKLIENGLNKKEAIASLSITLNINKNRLKSLFFSNK